MTGVEEPCLSELDGLEGAVGELLAALSPIRRSTLSG